MIFRDSFTKVSDGGTLVVTVEQSEPDSVWIAHSRDGKRLADIRLTAGEAFKLSLLLERAGEATGYDEDVPGEDGEA